MMIVYIHVFCIDSIEIYLFKLCIVNVIQSCEKKYNPEKGFLVYLYSPVRCFVISKKYKFLTSTMYRVQKYKQGPIKD